MSSSTWVGWAGRWRREPPHPGHGGTVLGFTHLPVFEGQIPQPAALDVLRRQRPPPRRKEDAGLQPFPVVGEELVADELLTGDFVGIGRPGRARPGVRTMAPQRLDSSRISRLRHASSPMVHLSWGFSWLGICPMVLLLPVSATFSSLVHLRSVRRRCRSHGSLRLLCLLLQEGQDHPIRR